MRQEELIGMLTVLAGLDRDASLAYGQVLGGLDESPLKRRLREFRADHDSHADDLGRAILQAGGLAPEPAQDFTTRIVEGFAAVRASVGTRAGLEALLVVEELTTARYAEAYDRSDAPDEVHALLERLYADERKHLLFIEDELRALRQDTGYHGDAGIVRP